MDSVNPFASIFGTLGSNVSSFNGGMEDKRKTETEADLKNFFSKSRLKTLVTTGA